MAASSSSSSGEQQYSLRWNDFHSSILSSFRHLRDEEDFVDVTLACDSSSFTAHKVVLSACSPYFRRLLKANPCQHPIVILRDVASSDMESLLRFMYHGEVHVGQEQLTAFLKTAQMLQVRGLADVNSGATKIPPPSSSANNGSAPTTPRLPWQDNGRGDGLPANESGLSPPPEKRPRSYSPPLGNHVETKSDLQESLLGQALEGGPTIHTTPSNNVQKGNHDNSLQAQSTGEDSNSLSDNEEDVSINESILNSVKTEPADMLNDPVEHHHRNTFPAALLGLQGLMPGPSGIHAANQDPSYGRWQPSGGDGSASSSGWVPGPSSSRNEMSSGGGTGSATGTVTITGTGTGTGSYQSQQVAASAAMLNQKSQELSALLNHAAAATTSQPQQQHAGITAMSPDIQLTMMHQKFHDNLQQSLDHHHHHHHQHQQHQGSAKKKIEGMAMLQPSNEAANYAGRPKCPECGKIYSNNSNLKQHIVNVHTVQTEYISCHMCSKQFKTKQYLQIHLLSMHGIRKRKVYPVYQMEPTAAASAASHTQPHQQTAGPHQTSQQQQQQQYPNPARWIDDKH
ncbi:protein abrupt isoform X4 [Neodiprion lecontei]|uniref:Protein abrupt isoform X4 n=1 Tax=Neodiprion lecontei TaxID=441921 RepID=A0ABM3FE32_NEOLC|nr:protein abrupt isoform X4 [Neodiprion lecontei]